MSLLWTRKYKQVCGCVCVCARVRTCMCVHTCVLETFVASFFRAGTPVAGHGVDPTGRGSVSQTIKGTAHSLVGGCPRHSPACSGAPHQVLRATHDCLSLIPGTQDLALPQSTSLGAAVPEPPLPRTTWLLLQPEQDPKARAAVAPPQPRLLCSGVPFPAPPGGHRS